MVSFEGQALKIAGRILALASIGAPCVTPAAPDLRPADRQQQIVETIQAEQTQNGPYSEDLLEPLRALSLLYQESGDHGLAGATIQQALQVVRANYGLRSLEQAPLLQQWIYNEEARGNFGDAWDLEQKLLTLARDNPDDLRAVSILHELGDKRMALLNGYVGGEFPPQIILGCFYQPSEYRANDIGSCDAGRRGIVVQSILSEAQSNYLGAIRVLLRHQLYSSEELHELEMNLLISSYQYGRYDVGKQSLRRLLTYDVANSEPLLSRVASFIRIADWDLMFEFSHGAALEDYEQAYEFLEQQGVAQTSIEQIFSPKVPVVIPTFLPNPLASEETPATTGHIDVAFEITKFGRSRKIEVLDTTTNATDAAQERLVRLIAHSQFRPRVTSGEFARSSPVVVRYYLSE